ncbi:glycosyltransferase [Reyranella sp. CPCC 100927]|uniref:glycosyltransferase family 2 protein n=1 Tax=Reyranella sp. CPCC 100927 TaxID=2599616 RepID=UPI0011B695A7|nr:glycosyltransferase [Reyranella sp. CPCC 100927]TWT12889.1 glycosyltransferase [Reyranella sp. CPCC 100927]
MTAVLSHLLAPFRRPDVVDNPLLDNAIGRPLASALHRLASRYWLRQQRHLLSRTTAPLRFDAEWYLARYRDVQMARVDPLVHYLEHGVSEGRDPHPLFHAPWYLFQTEASEEIKANPLGHYLKEGAAQGLSPHPLFDREYYRKSNPDVAASGMDPLTHFLLHGDKERRSPHPLFNAEFYLRTNPDIRAESGALRHYLTSGGAEGRWPHPVFDAQYYFRLYPELERAANPLVHYLMQSLELRRLPHPLFDGGYFRMLSALSPRAAIDPLVDYVEWLSNVDPALARGGMTYSLPPMRESVRDDSRSPLQKQPLVSILIPTYNSDRELLTVAVDSVRAQTYRNWELVIVDDGSPAAHMGPLLEMLAARDPRIRTARLSRNSGISEATNEALRLAKGDYIALVDHDDLLVPEAIEEVLYAMDGQGADVAYSDQAYSSAEGTFESPFYKPDWSPTLFAGVMYVGHLLVVRRALAVAVGGFDKAYDRVQDFEFMLRVSERADEIVHVPRMLYHWRRAPGSVAADANAKGKVEPVQCKAVNAHFMRTGFPAEATPHPDLPHRLTIKPNSRLSYPDIEALVCGWKRPSNAVAACVARLEDKRSRLANVRVISPRSARGALESGGSLNAPLADALAEALDTMSSRYLLWIDPLVQIDNPRWLDYLLLYAEQPDVAFVGPHLYHRDGRVGAAGLVLDKAGLLPAMPGFRLGDDGYAGALACDREVFALYPALMMIDTAVLRTLGGFDRAFVSPYYLFGEAAARAVWAGYRNIGIATALTTVDGDYLAMPAEAAIDAMLFLEKHGSNKNLVDPRYSPNFASGRADYT